MSNGETGRFRHRLNAIVLQLCQVVAESEIEYLPGLNTHRYHHCHIPVGSFGSHWATLRQHCHIVIEKLSSAGPGSVHLSSVVYATTIRRVWDSL